MTRRSVQGVLPFPQSIPLKTQRVVGTVEAQLPTLEWTPDRIERVASVLASLLVRDVLENPPVRQQIAS